MGAESKQAPLVRWPEARRPLPSSLSLCFSPPPLLLLLCSFLPPMKTDGRTNANEPSSFLPSFFTYSARSLCFSRPMLPLLPPPRRRRCRHPISHFPPLHFYTVRRPASGASQLSSPKFMVKWSSVALPSGRQEFNGISKSQFSSLT